MGASGTMQLTNPSLMASSTTQENVGQPYATDDIYNFDIDFSAIGPTFVFTGDFNFFDGGNGSGYTFIPSGAFPGTFNIHPSDGVFTYTVTAAQVQASGLNSHSGTVSASSSFGSSDVDTLNFNFTLCFAVGTGIATPEGEQAVEDLAIGDLVTTADGRSVPVKWIGRTSIHPMFKPADRLEPVRIRAGAFAPGVPNRDLIVTADHGMVLDGMVITAGALVNGTSVQWVDWRRFGQTIAYYHVETAAHDVILANGAAAETYIDYVARSSFDNHAEYLALYGDEAAISEMPLPRISSARMVPAHLRDRLSGTETTGPACAAT
ncbi:Hint domain protein [Antarctobacter heliothermus]|uniref:Hint domain protein n=1 Tax=Antarctobacter heliothermus TaxID=74033 RepID=A0A222DY89_9RHOB|nr:Hint domain-containing protein [Antarctobacter heliothermus]ASP18919.1 Hint domain protein [Antarctobacter heliothermus]